jgi:hypothetical protein
LFSWGDTESKKEQETICLCSKSAKFEESEHRGMLIDYEFKSPTFSCGNNNARDNEFKSIKVIEI